MNVNLRAAVLLALAAVAAPATDFIKGNSYGTPSAPVMIEIFSDFECPGCKLFHDTEFPRLMKDYVVPGKVYVIYRYFPLEMHAHGRKAAEVVAAAAQLGKYQEAADAAFAKQQEWSATGKIEETVDNVLTAADQQKLKTLMQSPAVQQQIQHDLDEGKAVPVPGTPALVVTHRLRRYTLSGREVLKYEWVKAFLDDLLSK